MKRIARIGDRFINPADQIESLIHFAQQHQATV